MTYTLTSRQRAEQRVRFFDQYRSYVINYNLGKDLVRAYVERMGGTRRQTRRAVEDLRRAAVVAAVAVGAVRRFDNHEGTKARRHELTRRDCSMTRTTATLLLSIVLGLTTLAAQKKPATAAAET